MRAPKILIVKTSAIGDVIHAFPVLEYLREKFPNAQIDWCIETSIAPLIASHPFVSNPILTNFKKWRRALFSYTTFKQWSAFLSQLRKTHYDVLFDLQANSKSALVTACANAGVKVGYDWKSVREKTNILATHLRFCIPNSTPVRQKYLQLVHSYYNAKNQDVYRNNKIIDSERIKPEVQVAKLMSPKTDSSSCFGILNNYKGVRLRLTPDEQTQLNAILSGSFGIKRPRLMLALGSKWPNKRVESALVHDLIAYSNRHHDFSWIFIYSDEEEKRQAHELVSLCPKKAFAVGQLTLPLWQALMWHVQGVIAVDSAALHLASTTLTPSFSFFGPSSANVYKPQEERHLALQGKCPYGQIFIRHCPKLRTCPTGACMKHFDSQTLFQAFEGWIATHVLSNAQSN